MALAALLAPAVAAPVHQLSSRNKLLLVSFDGFRWNYDQDVDTPNLDAMALEGVKARYMTPAFITLTSPCHFTLVTGKYIENHGVVHNMFYNTSSKLKLPYHTTLGVQGWWDNGSVPIWVTAQRQGLKTGSFFYPGGNVTYQGEAVTLSRKEGFLHNYKDEAEWRANIDTVMEWFTQEGLEEWRANIDTVMEWFTQEGLDLVTLYFGEPDSTGHRYGPESQERKEMVMQVDRTVGYLRDRIRLSGLESSLNLIITSDHGMSTVNKNASDLVELHKVSNFSFKDIEFELLDYGPNGMLLPKEGMLEKVYEVLKDAHPRLHVYKKENFPKSFHYANHSRVTPLLMYSDLGYVIHGGSSAEAALQGVLSERVGWAGRDSQDLGPPCPQRVNVQFNNGEHGFDNKLMDMKTIFRATGPSFKRGLEVEPFESVHVYELMCRLLGIVPEANDGLLSTLLPTLREEAGDTTRPPAPRWPRPPQPIRSLFICPGAQQEHLPVIKPDNCLRRVPDTCGTRRFVSPEQDPKHRRPAEVAGTLMCPSFWDTCFQQQCPRQDVSLYRSCGTSSDSIPREDSKEQGGATYPMEHSLRAVQLRERSSSWITTTCVIKRNQQESVLGENALGILAGSGTERPWKKI
ncbi:hypothetical protein CB1_000780005 [Camelus ferus]|nr:hypothetical protein CB1_000780005 [Camelus ferus]